ncbi:MAG: response regulator [Gammaproteobacteria bacterium]|nr:response regulator [Gammaproteobacteria bacterium]
MSTHIEPGHYRLLVVDDNRAIHEDFRKILTPDLELKQLNEIEADLFGKTIEVSPLQDFDIDSAFQGEEGLSCVQNALNEGRPYSLAFIDMRMPPGWNGIETIEHIWEVDPQLQIVICSAYSDHSWAEISQRLGHNDRLLILKKPFDNVEILQMAYAMSNKCELARKQILWQQSNLASKTGKLDSDDSKLLAPIEDIRESVKILQTTFEKFNTQFNQLRTALTDQSSLNSDQTIRELLKTTDFPEFGQSIPDVFQRLHLALKKVKTGSDTTAAKDDNPNKPVH